MTKVKDRDYLFDNIKGILIFLVVLGHLIECFLFKFSHLIDITYIGMYLFHMPAFVFISGYFSKKNNKDRILEIALIYTIWQMLIFPFFVSWFSGSTFESVQKPVFLPQWTYWYLLSLTIWKIITPYFEKIRFNFIVSVVMGILIGYSSMKPSLNYFSLGRTITFYPFFILGYYIKREHIYSIRNKINKYLGFISFIAILFLGLILIDYFDNYLIKASYIQKLLFLKEPYTKYMVNENIGALFRLLMYGVQFLSIIFLITFISDNKNILSKIGQSTLPIYLTHGILIKVIEKDTIFKMGSMNSELILTICIMISFTYCLLFCLKPIKKFGERITRINMDKILKQSN